MVSIEEGKAKRKAGMDAMSAAQKIRRDLMGGRPPASELKTPLSAVTAAATLHKELESRLKVAGFEPKPGDCGVSVGFVSPDLTVLGLTRLYAPGEAASLMERQLTGNIALGLVFGVVDEKEIVTGTRPFLMTKQTENWLSELLAPFSLELEYPA